VSSFLEIVERVRRFLESNGRVSLRALKREFDLDDDALDEVVEELVDVQQVAAREGKILTWLASSTAEAASAEPAVEPIPRPREEQVRPPAPAVRPTEAEHRQLTVMFCDLVGSTELSERLDAEDLSEVVTAYQKTCAASIESFEGHVAQYLGDGVLVYFGYPLAHEDDAVRAIHAALRITGEIPRLNGRLSEAHTALSEMPLQVRIGIHTGPVIVGEMGGGERRERLALGDTVNIAARLEAEAAPGSIVVSGATRHLVQGVFLFESLGERSLKGIEEPLPLFRAVQPTGVQSRLALAGVSGLTPLVGREREVGLLLERWEEAKAGRGQVVLLSGEAGMGKSRMIEVLREHVADEPHTWLEYRGSAYHQNSAFYPVIELLERALVFTDKDTPEERVGKLARGISYSGFPTEQIVPLIADFLGLPLPENLPTLALSPEEQRKRTMETLCLWPVALAQRQPMIIIAEDLHWWDPSSTEVAGMAIAQAPAAPILLVGTFRAEFEPPWPGRSGMMPLALHRLTPKQIEEMASRITGGKQLPIRVREQIAAKTDGVPLFVEELTKSVLESGLVAESDERYERTDPLPDLAIPATLRDSLTARLDRLGSAKEVAQLAAVLGREFSYDLLQVVSPLETAALDQALGELVGAGLLYQRGIPPRATYIFKHALIRDAAHESLLKKRRREYNALVASALEERFPDRAKAEPEVLAHHYEGAGLADHSAVQYSRAGMAAAERSANKEAIRHLERGLEQLATVPESPNRSQRQLEMELALGACVVAVQGYAHDDVERTFGRARELCREIGESSALARALVGLSYFHFTRTNFDATVELAREIVELGERGRESSIEMFGHVVFAFPLLHQGRFNAALEHFDRAISLYDPSRARALAVTYGHDFGVLAHGYSALAIWALGYPDQALERNRRSEEYARAGGHLHSLAWMLGATLIVHHMRREVDRVREVVEDLVVLAERHAFALWRGAGKIVRGCAISVSSRSDAGIKEYREGFDLCAATGSQFVGTIFLGWGAEAFTAAGKSGSALRALDMGFAVAEQNGERFWVAELHRQKGELFLAMEDHSESEAEQEFQQALEIAREQAAKSLELRASTSLARLWGMQGKKDEARALLAPIYEWFTEGFDTQDLKDAKALLEELS
jgi:class 3 adenylate cyclase/predicted ATPase